MQEQQVDARSIAVWRWATGFRCLVLFGAVLLPATAMAIQNPGLRLPVMLAMPLLLALLLWLVVWYPRAAYRHLRYALDDTGIIIREGIFWRTQSAVPRSRIQHTDVAQGPLQRHYGVGTLKLYTAGSRFTKVELPGLQYETAVALRDELQQVGDSDGV